MKFNKKFNKKQWLIIVLVILFFASTLPIAIQLGIWIHHYNVPTGNIEARDIAVIYMNDCEQFVSRYGDHYIHFFVDISSPSQVQEGSSATATFWVLGYGYYDVQLEYKNNQWIVVHSE